MGLRKVALITGVSSPRGIGTAICRKLAAAGYDIFFTYWGSVDRWEEVFQKEIRQMDVQCEGLEVDLSDANAASIILETVIEKLGVPSVLINNAAHSERDGYSHLNARILDDHYAVNMRSTILLSVGFASCFEEANLDHGRIIHIISGQELGAMPEELAYAATKGAISAFTKSLSAALASQRITVNAINPGPTDTNWMTDDTRQTLVKKFPSGRVGLPDDAARLIAFLASEEASWITGQIIHSEGGFRRE